MTPSPRGREETRGRDQGVQQARPTPGEINLDDVMEYLVQFDVDVPAGTPETEVADRQTAEASAAAKLAEDGHLLRAWKAPVATATSRVLSLYHADSETELNSLLQALPLYEWMRIKVTPLAPHPNDPVAR
jgi:muconolactone delta-isomerase